MMSVTSDQAIAEIAKLHQQSSTPIVVALDGHSGVGKSTLAQKIVSQLDGCVIPQDDFYSGGALQDWGKRTPAQKADLCMDWQRVRTQALEPLIAGLTATWHPFNWETLAGLSPNLITCQPKPIIVLDGVYSARPELSDLISLSLLVKLDDSTRRQRIEQREGSDFVKDWHPVWDEAEDYYFTHVRLPQNFDLVIKSD